MGLDDLDGALDDGADLLLLGRGLHLVPAHRVVIPLVLGRVVELLALGVGLVVPDLLTGGVVVAGVELHALLERVGLRLLLRGRRALGLDVLEHRGLRGHRDAIDAGVLRAGARAGHRCLGRDGRAGHLGGVGLDRRGHCEYRGDEAGDERECDRGEARALLRCCGGTGGHLNSPLSRVGCSGTMPGRPS